MREASLWHSMTPGTIHELLRSLQRKVTDLRLLHSSGIIGYLTFSISDLAQLLRFFSRLNCSNSSLFHRINLFWNILLYAIPYSYILHIHYVTYHIISGSSYFIDEDLKPPEIISMSPLMFLTPIPIIKSAHDVLMIIFDYMCWSLYVIICVDDD